MEPNEVRVNYRPELLAFFPSGPALGKLLQSVYLNVTSQALLESFREPKKPMWFQRALPPSPIRHDRGFTVCRPFQGVNDCHTYAPPFGLKAYDERFRGV